MEVIVEENDNEIKMYERESNNILYNDELPIKKEEENQDNVSSEGHNRFTELNDSLSNIIEVSQAAKDNEENNIIIKEENNRKTNKNNTNNEGIIEKNENENEDESDINIIKEKNDNQNTNTIMNQMPKDDNIRQYKIIILGDFGVGKTSFIDKYFNGMLNKKGKRETYKFEDEIYKKRIQIDENITVEIHLWDTAGQEKSGNLIKKYYIDSYGVFIVFDLTNKKSFKNLPKWINNIKDYCPKDIVCCFIGNKSDLTKERKVAFEVAKDFVKDDLYYEVSSKTGTNVSLAFEQLAYNIVEKQLGEEKNPEKVLRGNMGRDTTSLSNYDYHKEGRSKKGCC